MTSAKDGIVRRPLADGSAHYLATVFLSRGTDGKRREHSKMFRTRREARMWKRQQLAARDTGTYARPSDTTLGCYVRQWLDGPKKADPNVRAKTWAMYDRDIRRWLLPCPIADTPLSKLTTLALEGYYVSLRDVGMGRKASRSASPRSATCTRASPKPCGARCATNSSR